MADYKAIIEEAQSALSQSRNALDEDNAYYEAAVKIKALGTAMPPQMQEIKANVGISRLYLDSMTERIQVTGFRFPGSTEADDELQRWWQINDLDEEAPILHLETLIHGRCYVSVSKPSRQDILLGHPADVPMIRVESPRFLWVEVDPRTRQVKYAVRFYREPKPFGQYEDREQYTVYLPNETVLLTLDTRLNDLTVDERIVHNLGVVPVIPFYNRDRASDRIGRSEIVPELRSLQDIATRILMNMQAAAELMAVPQRLLFGVDKHQIDPSGGQDPYAKYKAFMANILTFKGDGDQPVTAQQFSAAELSNYTTALQEVFKEAASFTGLPPQYLTFTSDNPASADAIRSSESRLVKKCELKGRMFGNGWERVMRLGMLVMTRNVPEDAFRMQAIIADPATPTWSTKAQAAVALTGGKPVIPVERARIDLGYTPEEREEMRRMDDQEADQLANALLGRPSTQFPLVTENAVTQQKAADNAEQAANQAAANAVKVAKAQPKQPAASTSTPATKAN